MVNIANLQRYLSTSCILYAPLYVTQEERGKEERRSEQLEVKGERGAGRGELEVQGEKGAGRGERAGWSRQRGPCPGAVPLVYGRGQPRHSPSHPPGSQWIRCEREILGFLFTSER